MKGRVDMKESYEPAIYWLTHEEVLERQTPLVICPGRSSPPDPTANAAIGRMYRQEKYKAQRMRGGADRWVRNRRRM